MNRRFLARTALAMSILALGVAGGFGWSAVAAVKAQSSAISVPKPAAATAAPARLPSAVPPATTSAPQIPAVRPAQAAPVAVPDDQRELEPGDDHGSA